MDIITVFWQEIIKIMIISYLINLKLNLIKLICVYCLQELEDMKKSNQNIQLMVPIKIDMFVCKVDGQRKSDMSG